ncbi:MAG TPA: ATP-grasp domain-containing protein [Vicinamibacterales bacterium]|nr:ATP-grasp domain-containing protein [Vicinamibacterales bacterium]
MTRVLIAGVSCRAAAESAARAGFDVTAIDAFGDLDQHASVRALSVPRDFGVRFTPAAAARAARSIECDAVVYLSSFENHVTIVRSLVAGRQLWGNSPSVLRRVRDPFEVTRVLRKRGHAVLSIRVSATRTGRWLLKPVLSGGGRRVRVWQPGRRVPRGFYLQEFVEGTPGSIVFVAARGRTVPIGISRQLAGAPAFGATGFKYCGSILAPAGDAQFARDSALVHTASALARTIAEEFELVGVNGLDFVARDGVPYAIEVNPRWTASMELVERAYGLSVFAAHADACVNGALPASRDFKLGPARRGVQAFGKAIVFARDDVTVGDAREWVGLGIRDVPHAGDKIAAGRPVCTVFATGSDALDCHAALVERAGRVYADLATPGLRARRA